MRLFVALELPAAVRTALGARVEVWRREMPPARWVAEENLHVTLCFLGEIEAEGVEVLRRELAPAASGCARSLLQASGGGVFPPGRPARVVWAGIDAQPPLGALHAAVLRACRIVVPGLDADGAFHPHVTLARCPSPWPRAAVERFLAASAGPVGDSFTTTSVTLIESHLASRGPRYRPVAQFPLSAA